MKIPVENLYFLLCYAWDRLEEGEVVQASVAGNSTLADLFGHVLSNGAAHLLKRGLDGGYVPYPEEIRGVRGKVEVSQTVKRALHLQGRAVCGFDEWSPDVLHNRILKSTLGILMRVEGLDRGIRERLHSVHRRMSGISTIRITRSAFRSVQLHRNNQFYDFLLHVCRLVNESVMVGEQDGTVRFRDFAQDDRRMAVLFQSFVLNFLRREQRDYKVKALRLGWYGVEGANADLAMLPSMQTDIVLRSPTRTLLIDTKYYRRMLVTRFGRPKLRSEHLYQLVTYLRNLEPKLPAGHRLDGMLLYPMVDQPVHLTYLLNGKRVTARTLNLGQSWQQVRTDLLAAVAPE